MATLLYTAQTELKVYSVFATWYAAPGNVLPLSSTAQSTLDLLANGSIVLAPAGASDTVTPPYMLRGVPGLKAPGTVSN